MQLKIVTPERVVFEEDNIEAVFAPTPSGEVGILQKHQPMVSPLAIGVLRYTQGGSKNAVAVMGGLIRTDGQSVSILSDAAELTTEIDTVRAEHAKERAEARLRQASDSTLDKDRAQSALGRSIARIKAKSYH